MAKQLVLLIIFSLIFLHIYGEFLQTTKSKNYYDDLPTDTLHIFILNYTVYMTEEWSDILSNNSIMERIRITEDSLKSINYLIEIN